MIARRLLLTAVVLAFVVPASAEAFLYRVGGEVTPQTFDRLAAFATHSGDEFVGLKISVPSSEGDLVAQETNDVLVVHRKGGEAEITFTSGYRKSDGKFFVEGNFQVKKAGPHAVSLSPARTMDVDASGKPMKDIDIGKLEPGVKG